MYKCKHCPYVTTREFDLRRHERRKTPCSPHLTNTNTINAVHVPREIMGASGEIMGASGEIMGASGEIMGASGEIMGAIGYDCERLGTIGNDWLR